MRSALVAVLLAACGPEPMETRFEPDAGRGGSDGGRFTVTDPVAPFDSNGDLWFSTWASNDDVFVSWGDGVGPFTGSPASLPTSHNGLASLHGTFPDVTATVVNRAMPFAEEATNSKPDSLLSIDGRLYVAIHRPLLHPTAGFMAYSDDDGRTFTFPAGGDTWTKPSKFLCRMMLNMGKNYALNTDGYVYIYGIGSEIDWASGNVYLARVRKADLYDVSRWEYFDGSWAGDEASATPVPGLTAHMLFSAIFHPGLGKYVIMTGETSSGSLYTADQPWGPWTSLGPWFSKGSAWDQSYMPGIITKDLGARSFFFATGGVQQTGSKASSSYRFRLGTVTLPR